MFLFYVRAIFLTCQNRQVTGILYKFKCVLNYILLHCLHPTKSIDLVIRRLYSSLQGLWPLPYYVIFYKNQYHWYIILRIFLGTVFYDLWEYSEFLRLFSFEIISLKIILQNFLQKKWYSYWVWFQVMGQEHKHCNFCEVINQFRYNRRGHSIFWIHVYIAMTKKSLCVFSNKKVL